MPWTIKKTKDTWCVHKEGSDGKPMAESIKCHKTHAEALAHMRALYANTEGKSFEIFGDSEEIKVKRPDREFLVVEDGGKQHLPVYKDGKLSPRLLGAAHAALTVGYRGNKYAGPGKEEAIKKLKRLYRKAGLQWQERKEDSAKKSLSLMELEHKVHHAIKEKMMEMSGVDDEYDMPYCPTDVFVDFAIVKSPNGLYQIPYSFDAETYEVTLGEPNKVKIEYIPDDSDSEMDDEDMDKGDEKYKEMMEKKALDELLSVKALGEDRIGGYAVLWGNENKKDLTEEFFDKSTTELTAIYDAVGKLPYIYHHSLDENLKTTVIGIVDTLAPDDIGLWYETQLRKAGEYDEYIKKLIASGKLKTSTQTFPVARDVDKETGHIKRWPIVEITATPTPAEYRMQPVAFLKTAYQEVGCTDFECVLKKFGVQDTEDSPQGAEKARRLLAEIEQARLEIELV